MTAGGPARGLIDGRFELLERLGGGGMGLVWRARDTALEREVALKEVRPAQTAVFDDDPVASHVQRERVLREARALARLHHPNVVTIHHIVDSAQQRYPWLVMELISGGSLDDRLKRGALAPAQVARIGRGVLAALREATALTTTGTLIGSPEYIAPERIRGHEGDPASDLWSLGMLMYVAVEGENPLRRETTLATIAAVLDAPLPEPRRSGPLAPVLAALLVRDPAGRPDAAHLDQLLATAQREAERESGAGFRYGYQPQPPLIAPQPQPQPQQLSSQNAWSPNDAAAQNSPSPSLSQPPHLQAPRKRRNGAFVASVTGVAVVGVSVALVWTLHNQSASASTGNGGTHGTGTPSASGSAIAAGPTASASAGTDQAPDTGGSQDTQSNLLTAVGARSVVNALKQQVGGRKIVQITIYPDHAAAEVVTANDPTAYDDYTYRDGRLENSAGGPITDEAAFDPGTISWNKVPTLLTEAEQRLKVSNANSRYLIIAGNFFGDGPGIGVYIDNDYSTGGYMLTDFKGNILRVVK